MTIISTYATLIQAVQDVTEDDGTEMVAYIPTAIDLAEERLFKDLDLLDLETHANGDLDVGVYSLVKPTGYKFTHHLSVYSQRQFSRSFSTAFTEVAKGRIILKKRTEDFLQDYWPDNTVTGVPKYYADTSKTTFIIAPTPDSAYLYDLKYSAQPVKLGTTNTTNYYLEQCKDHLFFATMVEITKFQKAWTQVPIWEGDYQKAVSAWNVQAQRKRRDNGEFPQYAGGQNTIKAESQSAA